MSDEEEKKLAGDDDETDEDAEDKDGGDEIGEDEDDAEDDAVEDADDEDAEEGKAEGDDEGEEEDETPTVVIATLADLGRYLPEPLKKGFGDRPVWFIREDDQELVEIFDRLPEDPMPKGRAHELLRALRNFAEEHSDRLQEVLGISDGLVYGFHGDAPLSRVVAAFEQDGFFVCTGIVRDGGIEIAEG